MGGRFILVRLHLPAEAAETVEEEASPDHRLGTFTQPVRKIVQTRSTRLRTLARICSRHSRTSLTRVSATLVEYVLHLLLLSVAQKLNELILYILTRITK